MAHFVDGGSKGFLAAVDLTANQIVKLNAQGAVVAAAAATDVIIGVASEATKTGRTANIRLRSASGTLNVVAGGTIAIGDAVTSNASGAAITTAVAGNQIVGYAIEAGVTGQVIEILPTTAKV